MKFFTISAFLIFFCSGILATVFGRQPISFIATNNISIPTDTTSQIFISDDGTFGFDILLSGKILIHQPFIPGIAGTHGFATKNDAQKVALMMISKLKKHVSPPTISLKEIDSLHIIKTSNNKHNE